MQRISFIFSYFKRDFIHIYIYILFLYSKHFNTNFLTNVLKKKVLFLKKYYGKHYFNNKREINPPYYFIIKLPYIKIQEPLLEYKLILQFFIMKKYLLEFRLQIENLTNFKTDFNQFWKYVEILGIWPCYSKQNVIWWSLRTMRLKNFDFLMFNSFIIFNNKVLWRYFV